MVKITMSIILVFFLLVVVLLAAAALTGRVKRQYVVLIPGAQISLQGQKLHLSQLAQEYQPRMHIRKDTPTPRLMWVWYEAVQAESTINLTYYHAWENEINPSPTLHALYSVFRAAYYGYPLYDIEYFQLTIDKTSGAVKALKFESSQSDDFFQKSPDHEIAIYTLNSDGSYDLTLSTKDGKLIKRSSGVHLQFQGKRVLIGAQTWNHLTRAIHSDTNEYVMPQDASLRYLTNKEYAEYKFARKSHGDYQSRENAISAGIAYLALVLLVAVPMSLLRMFSHSKKIT